MVIYRKKWNNLINKCDIVYILGDFSFASVDDTKKILNKLNGQKHLIIGNHDGSCRSLTNYFQSVSHIKEVTFKKTVYPFLDETIHCVLCHYPLLTWNRRQHGSFNIHGHCHNNLFEFNNKSGELRVDIGFDSALAEQNNNFVELEELYYYFKNIRNEHNCENFEKYAKLVIENNKIDL